MDFEVSYNLMLDIGYDIKISTPGATADTPIDWGDVVSGRAYFYYIDENGVKSMKSGRYYFNTAKPGGTVFSSNEFTAYYVRRETPDGTLPVSISASSSVINMNGGGVWKFANSLNPQHELGYLSVYVNDNYPEFNVLNPVIRSPVGAIGTGKLPDYTTSPAVHRYHPNTPYIPVSGSNMSYNDLRQYIVNEYNIQNPEETININDLPAFDEDETEPTYDIQPFSIDYNEILGEREMESIIAETRYILDTTPYEIESLDYQQAISEPYEEIKKIAVLDSDTKTAMSKIYDVAERMTRNDFLSLYAFSAIISIIMWFVFRR